MSDNPEYNKFEIPKIGSQGSYNRRSNLSNIFNHN